MSTEESGLGIIGTVVLVIVFLAIIGGLGSESPSSQPSARQNTETWRQYISSPSENLSDQLANTQNLIVALGNDVSRLQTQNVNMQDALTTLNAQLRQAQEQAEKESRRQRIEQWVTTVVGTIGGWLLGLWGPTRKSLSKLRQAIAKLFTGRSKTTSSNSSKLSSQPKAVNSGCSTVILVITIVSFLAGLALLALSIFY